MRHSQLQRNFNLPAISAHDIRLVGVLRFLAQQEVVVHAA